MPFVAFFFGQDAVELVQHIRKRVVRNVRFDRVYAAHLLPAVANTQNLRAAAACELC